MRVFLDTNVLIDVREQRLPFCISSQAVFDRCDAILADVFVAWHGLATAYYIHSRRAGAEIAQKAIGDLFQVVKVAYVGDADARKSLALGWSDFEDAMQYASAEACAADVLVTRNVKDFGGIVIPIMTPEDFLAAYKM